MTLEQFRSIPINTGRMREFFNDPIVAQGIVCLRDEVLELLRGDSNDAIAQFNYARGCNNIIDALLELAEPIITPEPDPTPDWGVSPAEAHIS